MNQIFLLIYSCLLYLCLPFLLIRQLWRGRQYPFDRQRWRERLGVVSLGQNEPSRPGSIWIHAVSVGEAQAALLLLPFLQQTYPNCPIVITTTTATGSHLVQTRLGHSVMHYYLPYDLPFCLKRFFKHINPIILIIMETEVWPHLLSIAHQKQVPVLIANARLSEKSYQGYKRMQQFMCFMLKKTTFILAQSQADQQRFLDLGASLAQVPVVGNIKYDIKPSLELLSQAEAWRRKIQRPIWLAASTHPGEEQRVLQIYKHLLQKIPDLLLILAPRHPERQADVSALCVQQGLQVLRRSTSPDLPQNTQHIWLIDTIGELLFFYALCDAAFVGGSLVPIGGHNVLEPISLKKPVLVGRYMHNFHEIHQTLMAASALQTFEEDATGFDFLQQWLSDPDSYAAQVAAAYQILLNNRGALQTHQAYIRSLLESDWQDAINDVKIASALKS